jgi:hypothetical protein
VDTSHGELHSDDQSKNHSISDESLN